MDFARRLNVQITCEIGTEDNCPSTFLSAYEHVNLIPRISSLSSRWDSDSLGFVGARFSPPLPWSGRVSCTIPVSISAWRFEDQAARTDQQQPSLRRYPLLSTSTDANPTSQRFDVTTCPPPRFGSRPNSDENVWGEIRGESHE